MRYKLKRRRLSLVLSLVMALSSVLSGCGVTTAGNEPITLSMVIVDYVQNKTDKWLADEVIPAFEKAHPNIRVETIYLTWSTLEETVQGFFTAGKGADILNLRSEHLPQYGDRLAPLNPYLGEQAWADIRQYVKPALDTVTWKGELRGLPWLTAPRAYMCRTDLARSTATFAGAITEAKKATRIEGNALKRAGLVTTGRLDDWQEWLSLILGLGGKLYKEDGTPEFDSVEAGAALKFMYDRRRAVYPNETLDDLPRAKGSRLADGTAACVWGTLWLAPAPSDPLWNKIELSPGPTDPAFPESRPVVQVFSDWLAVPVYSRHIPEAAELLKFLGSVENQNRYNSQFGSLPPRKDAWTGYVAGDRAMQEMGNLMDRYGVSLADIREPARLREILTKEMSAYFTDAQDLETTMMSIQTQYTWALEE